MKLFKNIKFKEMKLKNIHLFDIFIVILALFVLLIAGIVLFRKSTYLTVTIKVGEDSLVWPKIGLPIWYLRSLRKGLNEKDIVGRNLVEIIDVFYYPSPESINRKMAYITVRLKAVFSKSSSSYTFNGRPLAVGNLIRIKPGNILIEGIITNVKELETDQKYSKIFIETQAIDKVDSYPNTAGVYPFVAESVNEGDTVKDSSGDTVIKVLDKRVEGAKRIALTDSGEALLITDPDKKDLYLTLEILATKQNEEYYLFDDIRIVINSTIPLQFKDSIIYATITDIHPQQVK